MSIRKLLKSLKPVENPLLGVSLILIGIAFEVFEIATNNMLNIPNGIAIFIGPLIACAGLAIAGV